MRIKGIGKLFLMGVAVAAPLTAQVRPDAETSTMHVNIGATYAPARFSQTKGGNFWAQGTGIQSQVRVGQRLGLVTDARIYYASNINSTGVGLNFVSLTAGPRYTLPVLRNMAVFGQGLFGGSMAYNGLFPNGSGGLKTSAGGLAIIAGGGMEMRLTGRVILRAIEVDRLRVHLPNGANDTQNALSVGAGVNYWFK
jgi:hypothetical protein